MPSLTTTSIIINNKTEEKVQQEERRHLGLVGEAAALLCSVVELGVRIAVLHLSPENPLPICQRNPLMARRRRSAFARYHELSAIYRIECGLPN